MSRRRERAGRRAPREAGSAPRGEPAPQEGSGRREKRAGASAATGSAAQPGRGAPGRRPPRLPFLTQVGILVAVFAIGTLVAELFGAANLGVALGVGQICFAIALVAVIVKT